MRKIAPTRHRDRLLQKIASFEMWKSLSLRQNFVVAICRTNSNWFKFVRQIKRRQTCHTICDKSLRQNLNQPMREHQLISRHVKFELIYMSSLSKSIAYNEQESTYRSDLSQHQCRREDLSPRSVAAICRIVCLGFNILYMY